MPYSKQKFVDREVDDLGKVIVEGTTLKAQHLNHIEDAVYILADIFDQLGKVLPDLMNNVAFKNDQPENLENLEKLKNILENGVTYYEVKTILQNVNISNTSTNITRDATYYAKLSTSKNYILENEQVKIEMGGIDITDEVYTEDGTIYIEKVTGDITITATAWVDVIQVGEIERTELAYGTISYQTDNEDMDGDGKKEPYYLIKRSSDSLKECLLIPIGQYLQKDTLYNFSLGSEPTDYLFNVLVFQAENSTLDFDIPEGSSRIIAEKRTGYSGWKSESYEYIPTENNQFFVMTLKVADGSDINSEIFPDLLSSITIKASQ